MSYNDINSDTDLPLYAGPRIYPQAIALSTLSLLTTILATPPLILQLQTKPQNLSTTLLILGIALANLQNTINPLLWPNDDTPSWPSGHILCDIEAKLQVWLFVAIPACAMCICRHLAAILSPNPGFNLNSYSTTYSSSSSSRFSSLPVFDMTLTLLLPTITTATHILIQPVRYYIYGISGCQYAVSTSRLSLPLLLIWPPILTGVGVGYAALVLARLYIHHRDVGVLLAHAATSRARFLRVFVLAAVLSLVVFPGSVWVCVVTVRGGDGGGWWSSQIHPEGWARLVLRLPSDEAALLVRWVQVLTGWGVFGVWGAGRDALVMYRAWIGRLLGVRVVLGWVGRGGRGLAGWLVGRRDGVRKREGVVGDGIGSQESGVRLGEVSLALEIGEARGENKTEVRIRSEEL